VASCTFLFLSERGEAISAPLHDLEAAVTDVRARLAGPPPTAATTTESVPGDQLRLFEPDPAELVSAGPGRRPAARRRRSRGA
jgi:hypothetical protein